MLLRLILYVFVIPLFLLFTAGKVTGQNTIFSIGNGNMAECPLTSPNRGWMQMLPMFFDPQVQFKNFADAGQSAVAFLSEGKWDEISALLTEGDLVLISFGMSQQTDLKSDETYRNTLTKFIRDARLKNATPVLVMPFTTPRNGNKAEAVLKEIGKEQGTRFIDLTLAADRLFEKEEQTDTSRLTVNQAISAAKMISRAIKDSFMVSKMNSQAETTPGNASPVFENETADLLAFSLRQDAALHFNLRQLPATKAGWETYKENLRKTFMRAAGVKINHSLPLDIRETGHIEMKGYTIRKIYFQTSPGIYATANLYVPDGQGVFPAVINLHGHWPNAKAGAMVQPSAHELALNGYVCLNIDAWGTGERTTLHGTEEYHGANLGASLLNIGETLLGRQLTDNIRGVDLLCSLPYVDKDNIGATGASGGGNQTMWLSALDERIKACMPVVSVGTFQSYILGSNCICELMPDGLTHTEESGVLALIAPRFLKIGNALQENNPTFYPSEMLRSYKNTQPIYALYGAESRINYQLFNTTHGYWPEMRQAMLGFFDLTLKGIGDGDFKKEIPFTPLSNEKLMVFETGKRDTLVMNTADYCIRKGKELLETFYAEKQIDKEKQLSGLRNILFPADTIAAMTKVHSFEKEGGWNRVVLETGRGHLIPLKYFSSTRVNAPAVLLLTDEKNKKQDEIIREYVTKGYNIIMADIWGKGEGASPEARKRDGRLPEFHTLARSELWLGKTILGQWVNDIQDLIQYIRKSGNMPSLTIDAYRETALAALMHAALYNNVDTCLLRTSPLSYALDRREGIDFFNMAVHLPGILKWGDIPLIVALNQKATIIFQDPVSITGKKIAGKPLLDYKTKLSGLKEVFRSKSNVSFSG